MIELVQDAGMVGLTLYMAWTSDGIDRLYEAERTVYFNTEDLKALFALVLEGQEKLLSELSPDELRGIEAQNSGF